MNPLARLPEFGQSVYVDEIRRSWLDDGTLQRFVSEDAVRGVTSNPAIFEKSIAQTDDYQEAIAALASAGRAVDEIYETLVVEDIARAADVFRPQFDASNGRYGWVSLEVSPKLANDTDGTVEEARRLFAKVDRPNVFIKVPGTAAGVPAIGQLIELGIPVNVTLLFGLERYIEVHQAYMNALQRRVDAGKDANVASVASFFLSRIDVAIDPQLDGIAAASGVHAERAQSLKGRVAVDNAKVAYADYLERIDTPEWRALEAQGARPQRLLWASTGTKNPDYVDTMYVEPLIGPDTVNTMPVGTLNAYRDHGDPATRITDGLDDARERLAALAELGIDLDAVTGKLETEGVEKFITPFESLMATLQDAVSQAR
jgi:transaldolase